MELTHAVRSTDSCRSLEPLYTSRPAWVDNLLLMQGLCSGPAI